MAALPRTATPTLPPLQNGEHLSRAEFECRYQAMPNTRAELKRLLREIAAGWVPFHPDFADTKKQDEG